MLNLQDVLVHLVKNKITYKDITNEIEVREFSRDTKKVDSRLSRYTKSDLHEIAYATNTHAFNMRY